MKKGILIILIISLHFSIFGQSVNYTYDSFNRITKVLYPDSSYITYTYDNVGNRTSDKNFNICSLMALPAISGTTSFCQGDSIVLTSSIATKYKWNIGDSTQAITVYNPGTYSVTVYNNKGCSKTATTIITVNDVPSSPIPDTNISSLTQIIWKWDTVSGATGYKWNTIDSYRTAIDMGTVTLKTDSGLACNASYTRYVWAYNSCGHSITCILTQNTTFTRSPTVNSTVTYCQNAPASPLTAKGSNLLWYNTATGGIGDTIAPTPTTTTPGTTPYYVSQTFNGCESPRAEITVITKALPNRPIITTVNGKELESSSGTGNQWYDTNGEINGDTSSIFTPTKSGNYYVIVTRHGCSSQPSDTMHMIITGMNTLTENKSINLFPNPNDGNFIIELTGYTGEIYTLEIWDMFGNKVFEQTVNISGNKFLHNVNVANFANGIYSLKLSNVNVQFKRVFIIQK